MTRAEQIKDCEAGLLVAKAMLVEAAVNLERAKVAFLRAEIDLNKYTSALLELAAETGSQPK